MSAMIEENARKYACFTGAVPVVALVTLVVLLVTLVAVASVVLPDEASDGDA